GRLQRAISLRLDVFLRVLDDALVLGLGLLAELLAQLLSRTVGAFDHRLRRLASIDELALGLLEACLRICPCFLRLVELFGDRALSRLGDRDEPRIDRLGDAEKRQRDLGEEQDHQDERDDLDDERPVDRQRSRVEKEGGVHYLPIANTNNAPNATLMKYIASQSPMMMNMMPCK